jgi:hypothetical protein
MRQIARRETDCPPVFSLNLSKITPSFVAAGDSVSDTAPRRHPGPSNVGVPSAGCADPVATDATSTVTAMAIPDP